MIITLAALATLGAAAPAVAQARGRGNGGIPPGQRPPAGMCRVWIDGVPPGRQPRATDCSTAVATVPSNGRVIWGDRTSSQRVYDPRVYDPRTSNSHVYTSGGDVARSCTPQIVNGVVRTVCDRRHADKHKKLKSDRKSGKDGDERIERSARDRQNRQ
jgi:hypothetical protein